MRRYPQHKKSLLMLVVGSTAFAVINRMWLMADAGYAGSEDSNKNPDGSDKNDRYVQLDRETAARKYWTSQAALLGTQQDQGASSPAESETKTGEQRLR